MRRREFITLMGGVVATWPVATRAQQDDHVALVGVLLGLPESDPEGQARFKAFRDGLRKLGWIDGRNVKILPRWAGNEVLLRSYAAELVGLKSDLIVAAANPAMIALHQATKEIPIVFTQVSDPVTNGFVKSLAQPGGNMTGFIGLEDAIAAKWLALLKEIAPRVQTVGVMYDPNNPSWNGFMRSLKSAADSSSVQLNAAGVSNEIEVDHVVDGWKGNSSLGLIVFPSPATTRLRKKIPAAAALNHIPAIYPFRFFVDESGLMYYGVENLDLYRQAASYADRILKGDKPATLPVQNPTKFELVINLKTAKALGITVPQTLLVEAADLIE